MTWCHSVRIDGFENLTFMWMSINNRENYALSKSSHNLYKDFQTKVQTTAGPRNHTSKNQTEVRSACWTFSLEGIKISHQPTSHKWHAITVILEGFVWSPKWEKNRKEILELQSFFTSWWKPHCQSKPHTTEIQPRPITISNITHLHPWQEWIQQNRSTNPVISEQGARTEPKGK